MSSTTRRTSLIVLATIAALVVAAFFVQKALATEVQGGLSMDSAQTWSEDGSNTVDPGTGYYVRDDGSWSSTIDCIAGCGPYASDPYPAGEKDTYQVGVDQLDPDVYAPELASSTDSLSGWHFTCTRAWAIVTHNAAVTGWDMYKAKWSQEYCYNGIRVANVSNLHDKCWMTGFGSSLGWNCSDDEGGDANGHYNNDHKSHTSWTRVHFWDCLSVPTGCIPHDDVYWKGNMQVFRKDGFTFEKHNG
jgi:hypothetical protein